METQIEKDRYFNIIFTKKLLLNNKAIYAFLLGISEMRETREIRKNRGLEITGCTPENPFYSYRMLMRKDI